MQTQSGFNKCLEILLFVYYRGTNLASKKVDIC